MPTSPLIQTVITGNSESAKMSNSKKTKFEEANQETQPGIVSEFIDFLKHNQKVWLIPLLAVLLLLGLLVILGGTAAAPFIYTLF
jgi:hypothetical protein